MKIEFNKVTWYSKFGAIILFILVVPTLTFYIGRAYQETTGVLKVGPVLSSRFDSPQFSGYLNSTYNVNGYKVVLKNGASTETIPGSNSTIETKIFGKPTFGDIDGDGTQDATFFLSQETGGSGFFVYVAVALNKKNGTVVGTNSLFLGDRISPQNINMIDGAHVAAVNYVTRGPNEPMAAGPSVGVTTYVTASGGKLEETRKPVVPVSPISYSYLFEGQRAGNTGNIVGHFGNNAFGWYIPDWLTQNWKIFNQDTGMIIEPKIRNNPSDFSSILFEIQPSTETVNAETSYQTELAQTPSNERIQNEVLLNQHTEGGISIVMETNTRIYHFQKKITPNKIRDMYYLDGNGYTLIVSFEANEKIFDQFSAHIRSLIEGIGELKAPQG